MCPQRRPASKELSSPIHRFARWRRAHTRSGSEYHRGDDLAPIFTDHAGTRFEGGARRNDIIEQQDGSLAEVVCEPELSWTQKPLTATETFSGGGEHA